MPDRDRPLFLHIPMPRQRGQALLVLLVILVVAGSAVFYSFAGPTNSAIERDKITAAALAQAKTALIGYAASDPNQPGVLPCPDRDNDGSADAPCGATGVTAIGRLPWKTLGLSALRDGSGECLWYAVSANFKNSGTSGPSMVNSDSSGTLIVNNTDGTPLYSGSSAVLAIVFAPNGALPDQGQDRSPSSTAVCGGNTTVANYLENGNQNGAVTDIFVSGQVTSTFNDELLPITSEALFSVVILRVIREMRAVLRNYYDARKLETGFGYFPTANPFSDDTLNCNDIPAISRQGRLPRQISNPPKCLAQSNSSWNPPPWFFDNNWNRLVFYAIAPECAGAGSLLCETLAPSGILDLLGSPARALLIGTGRGFGDQPNRPCGAANCTVSDLLDDRPQNTDGDDTFVKPVLSPANNDRLVIVSP